MAWPSESLMTLNRSRSMNSTATPPARSCGQALEALLDAARQQRPVGQVGQRVVEGLVLERGLEPVTARWRWRPGSWPAAPGRGRPTGRSTAIRWNSVSAPTSSPEPGARSEAARAWVNPWVANSGRGRAQAVIVDQVEHEHLARCRCAAPRRRARSAAARRRTAGSPGGTPAEVRMRITPSALEHADDRGDGLEVPLEHRRDLGQGHLERRAAGDGLQQVGLLGQQVLGPPAGR